jgi:hypothetical protein
MAVKKGRRLAKKAPVGQLKIKGKNGRVQSQHKY